MARKGPVGGAFGRKSRKMPETGTHNRQTWQPRTEREAQVGQLLRQKSAELEKMREAERGERKNSPDPRNPLDVLFKQGLGIRLRARGYDAYRAVIAAIRKEYPAALKLTNPDKIRRVVELISAKVVDEFNRGRFPDPWYQEAFAKRIEETHKEILKKLEIPVKA